MGLEFTTSFDFWNVMYSCHLTNLQPYPPLFIISFFFVWLQMFRSMCFVIWSDLAFISLFWDFYHLDLIWPWKIIVITYWLFLFKSLKLLAICFIWNLVHLLSVLIMWLLNWLSLAICFIWNLVHLLSVLIMWLLNWLSLLIFVKCVY